MTNLNLLTNLDGSLERLLQEIKTTEEIINDLKQRNLLVYAEKYPHVYPHCWRSGDELVFRLVDEWYINMDWRKKIQNIVDDIKWIPKWGMNENMNG